jgi:uncharacterized protein YbbC (DUF1343 family)
VTDRSAFKSVLTGVACLQAIYQLWPDEFGWKEPPYEYVFDKLPFDVIAGTGSVREQIVAATPLAEIEAGWSDGIRAFREQRRPHLLY